MAVFVKPKLFCQRKQFSGIVKFGYSEIMKC